jgi:hypothetical protein
MAGSTVVRSLSPLPPRTRIWFVAKSTSWTRSRTAFEHAQARPVQQAGHEPRRALEPLDHRAQLVAGQDDWQSLRALGTHDAVEPRQVDRQHVTVEEQERAQRLVLGRGGHPALDRERVEDAGDLGSTQLGRMTLAMEEDVPVDPGDVGLFCAATIVAGAQGVSHAVEKAGLGCVRGPGLADRETGGPAPDCVDHRSERSWKGHANRPLSFRPRRL